jgi:integrase
MPRRKSSPRLYLDRKRQQWIIRDGASFLRTGCAASDRSGAETRLAQYLAEKHQPQRSENPPISDVLLAYASEHLPHTKAAKNAAYNIGNLSSWWADKVWTDVTAKNCRAYAAKRTKAAARRDLEALRAAMRYWHREYGPMPSVPDVVLPPKPGRRERWLTRAEAAKILKHARHTPHLARFLLLGIYTGTRSGALLALEWSWIDLKAGVMHRRPPGAVDSRNKRYPPVRLGSRILAHLHRWRRLDGKHCKYVCHYHGTRVAKLRRSWRAAVQAAGVTGQVVPHTLRHSRATWLMQKGVDVWEAAGSLGMTPQMLTEQYGHHHPDWQRNASEV